jgi:polar amino acid transport system permease protein
LSAIALPELTGTATVINARTLLYIQTFSVVALVYLVLSNLFSWLGTLAGRRMFHPPLVTSVKKSAWWRAKKYLTNPLQRERAL